MHNTINATPGPTDGYSTSKPAPAPSTTAVAATGRRPVHHTASACSPTSAAPTTRPDTEDMCCGTSRDTGTTTAAAQARKTGRHQRGKAFWPGAARIRLRLVPDTTPWSRTGMVPWVWEMGRTPPALPAERPVEGTR
ncbi:hypothetical protein Pme01_23270 [Planosporangium mesophilum]|uniref:Uncharacterized protein n=1 Tax=Planosporangium mesophilum TaxID=689768 RepID=A0A8J3WZW0_9ACTN|nr:hypothetical protein Pme01_23270 [Planosporangium mesophilum]